MRRKQWAWLAGGVALLSIVVLAIMLFANGGRPPPARAGSPDSYQQQMNSLKDAFDQGKAARDKMLDHRITPTRPSCAAMYRATVASELDNPEFEAEVEPFYVSGCMTKRKNK